MPTLTAEYLDDLARVRLEAGDLDPEVVYSIERSTDGGTSWVTVRGATNITDGGVAVVYDYEYAPNVENRYRLTQPLVSDTFERTTGPGGLVLPGVVGSYASTPNAPAVQLTGSHSLRVDAILDSWANGSIQALVAKYDFAADERSYSLLVNGTGLLRTSFSPDGSTVISANSTEPVPITSGQLSARRDYNAGTGDVTFFTATIFNISWTQLGDVVPTAGGAIHAGTAPLVVGALGPGTANLAVGTIRSLEIRDETDTVVVDTRFADQPTGTTAFNDDTGLPWTVHGTAHIVGSDQAWGSADTGQLWELYVNSGVGDWSVSDGAGRVIEVDDVGFGMGRFIDGAFTDVEVQYDLIVTATFNQTRLSIRGGTSSFSGYEIIFSAQSDGTVRLAEFTGDGPATGVDVGTWQTGQRWRIKARVVGTVIEAKAWNTVNPEPSTWQIVTTSTNSASGTIGVNFNLDNAGEGIIDNFLVHGVPPLAVATATVTPEQDDVWLKSIAFPALNQNLGCIQTTARTRRSRVGLFDVKGRHAILGIADVGSTETFTALFDTHSQEENTAITGLLTFGAPLLLQSPPDADETGCGNIAAYPSGWFMPGDSTQVRPLLGKRVWEWQVPLTRVAAPDPQLITPAHMTWSVLWQMVNTWVELWDEWATWAQLWNANVAPSAMFNALSGGESI